MPSERVISISITEADWRALLSVQPKPVVWIKELIQQQIAQARQESQPTTAR
ncbi:MAG: hypothetical protein ACRD2X_00615 [Vicinamibacteraceae bacterium]